MKLNSFRIKLGDVSTNHFYLQKPCVQQETARLWRLLLCFRSGKAGAAWLSSAWHTVTQNQGSNQIQVMHFTSPCYTHFVGRDFPGRVQLHRRRAGGAPLIISLTLWTWGTQTHSDKGCLYYRLFPNTVTEFHLLQNVLFSPICKSSYRKSVCRIQPWLLCCELALFDQLSDTCT